MKIHLDQLESKYEMKALALGSFDGVHLGHRELIKAAIKRSSEGKSGVLTFSPHPREFFSDKSFSRIYQEDQNHELLLESGADHVFIQKFDDGLSQMTATQFLNYVSERLKFQNLVVGFDFRFGKDREAGQDELLKWCAKNKVNLVEVPCFDIDGEKVSSTLIKKELFKGNVDKAAFLLGDRYHHRGFSYRDQGLGKRIGFPTINMKLSSHLAILKGVYKTSILIEGGVYRGVSNIGHRPSVSDAFDHLFLETHILDSNFSQFNSCSKVQVEFESFIRPEQKFDTISELKAQISRDVEVAKGS